MNKILYIVEDKKIDIDVDVLVLPIKHLSSRNENAFTLDEVKNIINTTSKEVYFLLDAILFENLYLQYRSLIEEIVALDHKILFSDLSVYEIGKAQGKLDNLIYYSPTLLLNPLEINSFKELGIKNFIISKECEYAGYEAIFKECIDVNLGMIGLAYPQLYFSHRKMLSSYEDNYEVSLPKKAFIKEKARDFKMPILEDEYGTYIFGAEVFYPGKFLKNLSENLTYILIDPLFIDDGTKTITMVKEALNGNEINLLNAPTTYFNLFKEMINNYEKN